MLRTKQKLDYSHEFFDRCTSLFFGFEAGHMGSDMYCDHDGVHYNAALGLTESMSGVTTWDAHAKHGSIPRYAHQSFLANLYGIADEVGMGLPIVEYGPGSMDDAKQLIEATQSNLYIPADISEGIIKQSSALAHTLNGCDIKPVIMDLFANNNEAIVDEPAMAALLGLTITNIPGSVPTSPPREALICTLNNLRKPIGKFGGYLLVSTHTEQDGELNKALYNESWHRKFGVNFLYRMQQELPMSGFNPDYFEYVPIWHEQCSLLAHTVRATRDQTFRMGNFSEIEVRISAGDTFHTNNSYKFKSTFFESCALSAGLKVVRKWEDARQMALYLFEVPPNFKAQSTPQLHIRTSVYSI